MSQGRIIDDLLDMSRVNTGKLTVNRVPLVLSEAVQPAVNWAISEARERGIRLFAEGLDEPLTVDGDATRIEQIAWNLLSNAIKFSRAGGTIRVRLREQSGQAVFEVSDNGRGISAEFLPHVFHMFKQADSATRRGEGGLGIGLAMVKSLTELHGGQVELNSGGEGRGATFRVMLPLHQSSDFAALDSGDSAEPSSLVGLRVLLVDDTEDALETFRYLLENAGYQVTCASSAKEAIALAEREEFDLMISDVGMPQMDGYELVRELRQRDRTPAAVEGHTAVRTRDDTRAPSLHARKHIVEGHGSSSEHVGKAESRLCAPGAGPDDQSKGLIVRAEIRRFEHAVEHWLRDRVPRRIGAMNGSGPHGGPSVPAGNLSALNRGDREEDHEQRRNGSCHVTQN